MRESPHQNNTTCVSVVQVTSAPPFVPNIMPIGLTVAGISLCRRQLGLELVLCLYKQVLTTLNSDFFIVLTLD